VSEIRKKMNFTPKPSKVVRLGIVGVGGCGTNTIKDLALRLDPEESPNIKLLAANTDGPQLWDFFLSEDVDPRIKKWVSPKKYGQNEVAPQLQVLQLGDTGAGAGGKPDVARAAAESRRSAIEEFLDDVDVVVIQCGLGGGTGTGATPVFVEIAKEKNKRPLVVATLPFQFEGKKRLDRAAAARESLLNIVPTVSIYNDWIPDKKVTFDAAWRKVTEHGLLPPLFFLRRLLQVVGAHVNRDLADYGTALGTGHHVLSIGINEVERDVEVQSVITRLLQENPYQDMKILETAQYIIPMYEGPWDVDEVWEINQAIANQVRVGRDDFEMNYFVGNSEGIKSVGMLIVAKTAPLPPLSPNTTSEQRGADRHSGSATEVSRAEVEAVPSRREADGVAQRPAFASSKAEESVAVPAPSAMAWSS
jgi:cell division GTPase FtsZ